MKKKGPSRWARLSPKRNKKSKLGRLTSISETEPFFLAPLQKQYEKVVTVEKIRDPETNQIRRKRYESYRLDEHGHRIEKAPKEWAFGAWDIESHCYEHTCPERHRGCRGDPKKCSQCEACPACNPEHGEHWIAAQLSILRIPDQYIEYVNTLDESEMFGGTRVEGGRYVEFLNGGRSVAIIERARCIAPDGCIDRTLRFLMAHPCFFQKAQASKGYAVKGQHTQKCELQKHAKLDGSECAGCLRRPYAPGVHTSKCRFERGFRKKDGTPCEGCSTLSTAWYSHFGGGYDINFALRWLSEHGKDFDAAKEIVFSVGDDEEKAQLKDVFETRYQYKAESLLAGAAHIQVKLSKLIEVYKKPKPTRAQLASLTIKPKPGSKDYWLQGWLGKNLYPGGDLCDLREAQQTLNLIMKSKLVVTGTWNERTEKAIKEFQKKCILQPTGEIDRETSAALRYLRSQTTREPDPKQTILLRDSFRLVGSRLDTAAKDFDLKHPITGEKLTKIDDIDVRDPPPPDDEEYRRYCRIDTEICVQLVTTFNKLIRELGGTLEMTASACAVSLFRRRYLTDKVPRHRHFPGCRLLCPSCGTEACSRECGVSEGQPAGKNLERHQRLLARYGKTLYQLCPTYPVGCFHFTALSKNGHRHGGHVDVLRQKLERGRCYDVNSLYPFAMLGPVPTGPMQHLVCLNPTEKRKLKPGSPLALAASSWESRKKRTLERAEHDPQLKALVDKHGLDFATLEVFYRLGADRGPDSDTGEPFDDPDFNKVDSFKRIRQCGYVEAIVSIPKDDATAESYFPPLPIVRDSKNGEILFWPVGDGIHGWWCYEELRTLLEVPGSKLVAVRQSVWFRGEPIFKDFIEKLYAMRKTSDGAMKQLLKILMNSTYGKTLQNPLKRRVLRLQSTQERPAGWLPTNPNPPGGDDFTWPWGTVQEYQEAPFFLPHWGSLITARARTVIWRICVDVERGKYGRGKKVAYLDTDSCYTDAELPEDSKKLGMLKLEYTLSESERQKHFKQTEEAWTDYQRKHEAAVAAHEGNASASDEQKRVKIGRHKARLRFYKKKHYDSEMTSSKYQRARPEGLIACEFHGPKLYLVTDPSSGVEIKTVHKGVSEPNAAKLRLFIQKQEVTGGAKAPKAGVGIRDDFKFNPIELKRKGNKILWDKPGEREPELAHKRIHHHDPSGHGTTSPRFVSARDEFELEESFRKYRMVSAASLYEEWTGQTWSERVEAETEVS
jgi:hypothetical protein